MQRSWRIVLISVVVAVAVALTGLGMAYALGAFASEGRFQAAPACTVIDPATVAEILPAATITAQPADGCVAERDNFAINFKFTVMHKSGRIGAPDAARLMLESGLGLGGDMEPLTGVGDQAVRYRSKALGAAEVITMRVSNLIVVVTTINLSNGAVADPPADALAKVAAALGTRLATGA